eukprot:363999-Chlamydomonas_euryale.AAC.1
MGQASKPSPAPLRATACGAPPHQPPPPLQPQLQPPLQPLAIVADSQSLGGTRGDLGGAAGRRPSVRRSRCRFCFGCPRPCPSSDLPASAAELRARPRRRRRRRVHHPTLAWLPLYGCDTRPFRSDRRRRRQRRDGAL